MKYIEQEELKRIQLDMLVDIHNFCVKNHIKYWLDFGTLIGAIRHNGYIPWDDDIDISMPRVDYMRFMREYKSKRYCAECCETSADYDYQFGKVYDSKTVLKENTTTKKETGVFIDVFPYDNVTTNINDVNRQRKELSYITHVLNIRKNKLFGFRRSWKKMIAIAFLKLPTMIYNKHELALKSNTIAIRYNNEHTNSIALFFNTILCSISAEAEVIPHKFEGYDFYIPKEYDKMLTSQYGNYMTPPEDKSSTHVFKAWWKE